jgi:hypothetical protein
MASLRRYDQPTLNREFARAEANHRVAVACVQEPDSWRDHGDFTTPASSTKYLYM